MIWNKIKKMVSGVGTIFIISSMLGCTNRSYHKDYINGKVTIHVSCNSDFTDSRNGCEDYLKQNCADSSIYAKTYYSDNVLSLHATCQE